MKRLLHLTVFLIVTAVFTASLYSFQSVFGITSPWFALIVTQCFLGLVAFGRPLFLLRMPRLLRDLRPWESKNGLYSKLGVSTFGGLLRRTPLRCLNPPVYLNQSPDDPTAGRRDSRLRRVQNSDTARAMSGDAAAVCAQLESAEAAHLWAAVLLTPYMVYASFQNWFSVVAWFILFQIAGNLYPIFHLRLARGRLNRYFERRRLSRSAREVSSTKEPTK